MKLACALLMLSCCVYAQVKSSDWDSYAYVQQLPEAPQVQENPRFLNPVNDGLILANALTWAADVRFTVRAHGLVTCIAPNPCTQPFKNSGVDPLLLPAVKHGNAAAAGVAAGMFGLETFAAYELHKHGHERVARGLLTVGLGYSAGMAGYGYFNYHDTRPRGQKTTPPTIVCTTNGVCFECTQTGCTVIPTPSIIRRSDSFPPTPGRK